MCKIYDRDNGFKNNTIGYLYRYIQVYIIIFPVTLNIGTFQLSKPPKN